MRGSILCSESDTEREMLDLLSLILLLAIFFIIIVVVPAPAEQQVQMSVPVQETTINSAVSTTLTDYKEDDELSYWSPDEPLQVHEN